MSMTRRAFLQRAALSACALRGLTSSGLAFPGLLQIDRVIFDAKHCYSLAFAETAQRLGATTHAFYAGGTHGKWQDRFARLHRQNMAIAGLTDFRSLFFLQAIAADAGFHPVLRIHHRAKMGGGDLHQTFGAQAYRAVCDSLLSQYADTWAHQVAQVVLNLPAPNLDAERLGDNIGEANARVLASSALVTWVIA